MAMRSTIQALSILPFCFLATGAMANPASEAPAARSPDACLKAINVLGAAMGHTESTAADGRLMYKFRLRTSGLDYEATCDAATGVVGDVKPRLVPSTDNAS